MDFVLAILPIGFLICVMTKKESWPSYISLPFAATLVEAEQKRHAAEYISGLLSNLEHKTGEGIAYLHDQQRQGLQKFIGHVPWDHRPLLTTLAGQVGEELGDRPPTDRVDRPRRDLGERLQHESPDGQARMRDDQLRGLDDSIVE